MSLRYSSLGRCAVPPCASTLWSSATPAAVAHLTCTSTTNTLPHLSSHSHSSKLPTASSSKPSYIEPNYFTPEELASQLTLLDMALFKAINPDELTSCSWNKKNKLEVAPNVVALTRRFNHVSFWVVQEVLRPESPKVRAEILAHFIKVAKRLQELNSLHALFAVLSAMQSASLWRLTKTWSQLNRRDRQVFDKLTEMFSERDNFARLREHMDKTALKHQACIPYLGLYLTDLVYIDSLHPHSGGLESQQRQNKMNNILRIVSELQQSSYAHLAVNLECQQYLRSIRYIDELQKFLEDDQWKRSLQLEPNSSAASSSSSSKESVHSSRDPNLVAELNLSPAKGGTATYPRKFVPGHRKSRSDGGSLFWACTGNGSSSEALPPTEWHEEKSRTHLLDGSLMDTPSCQASGTLAPPPRVAVTSCNPEKWKLQQQCDQLEVYEPGTKCTFEGVVKRKTLIKEGRRPTVTGWQRYWLELWGSSLVFYSPKTLSKGAERSDFRSDPTKFHSIQGWLVMVASPGTAYGSADTTDQLSFQLTDPVKRNVYRFRAMSPEAAKVWVQCLHDGVRGLHLKTTPTNLISFE